MHNEGHIFENPHSRIHLLIWEKKEGRGKGKGEEGRKERARKGRRGKGKEKRHQYERKTSIGCLPYAPLGTKPAT